MKQESYNHIRVECEDLHKREPTFRRAMIYVDDLVEEIVTNYDETEREDIIRETIEENLRELYGWG